MGCSTGIWNDHQVPNELSEWLTVVGICRRTGASASCRARHWTVWTSVASSSRATSTLTSGVIDCWPASRIRTRTPGPSDCAPHRHCVGKVSARFASLPFRSQDVSPPERFASWCKLRRLKNADDGEDGRKDGKLGEEDGRTENMDKRWRQRCLRCCLLRLFSPSIRTLRHLPVVRCRPSPKFLVDETSEQGAKRIVSETSKPLGRTSWD